MKKKTDMRLAWTIIMTLACALYILPMLCGCAKSIESATFDFAKIGMAIGAAAIGAALCAIIAPMAAWFVVRAGGRLGGPLLALFALMAIVPEALLQSGLYDAAWSGYVAGMSLGMGVSVWICSAYIRLLPIEAEETAALEGHTAGQIFFGTVMPQMRRAVVPSAAMCAAWILGGGNVPVLALIVPAIALGIAFAVRVHRD